MKTMKLNEHCITSLKIPTLEKFSTTNLLKKINEIEKNIETKKSLIKIEVFFLKKL